MRKSRQITPPTEPASAGDGEEGVPGMPGLALQIMAMVKKNTSLGGAESGATDTATFKEPSPVKDAKQQEEDSKLPDYDHLLDNIFVSERYVVVLLRESLD